MHVIKSVSFVFLVFAVSVKTAFGWGAVGHEITAAVAAEYISGEVRDAVNQILDGRSMASVAPWYDT